MKLIKPVSLFVLVFVLFTSCQSVKNTLSMKKKQNVDEFLIEKKNPLTLPPEFSNLPVPRNDQDKTQVENEDLDLSEVLGKTKKKKTQNSTGELEKSISDILNKK
ncbi:DUF3035 domain-containing protein [Pelagibacterales bacterium SAG-MED39]|nr:DUF3035 domain-containing protein [Pelagibacterales bacterium SAG-MED39]